MNECTVLNTYERHKAQSKGSRETLTDAPPFQNGRPDHVDEISAYLGTSDRDSVSPAVARGCEGTP